MSYALCTYWIKTVQQGAEHLCNVNIRYMERNRNAFSLLVKLFWFVQAGIGSRDSPEQLLIALEPEAASLFCTAKKLNQPGSVSAEAGLSQPNTHYMIVDIGGNCVAHVFVVTTVCVSKVVKLPDPGESAACDCCPKSLELVQSR